MGAAPAHDTVTVRVMIAGFVLAAILRLVTAVALPAGYAEPSDPWAYATLAQSVLDGDGLRLPILGGVTYAVYPPLYPLALAALGSVFGVNALSITLLNLACDAATCAAVYFLALRLLGSPRKSATASLLYAFWPSLLFSVNVAQKENLALLFVTLALLGGASRRWVLFGAAIGCLALTQPAWLPIGAAATFLALPLKWPQAWRLGLSAAAVALVLLLPWWLRNWLTFAAFVPLTTSSGLSMHVAATGQFEAARWLGSLGEIEASKAAAREAASIISFDPTAFVIRRVKDFARAFVYERATADRLYWVNVSGGVRALLWAVTQFYWIGLVTLLALASERRVVVALAIAVIATVMMALPFEFNERHRYVLMPLVFVAAAAARVRVDAVRW